MEPSEEKPSSSRSVRPRRAWSMYLLSIAGIPIYLHFTFILMLVAVAAMQTGSKTEILSDLGFIVCVFASVALHELGHALMARRFGIQTEDIVLYPIGGVARLRSMGEGMQEFWIALAGPSVNVLIAGLIAIGLTLTRAWPGVEASLQEMIKPTPEAAATTVNVGAQFVQQLMFVNIFLVLFNMIPAFPMDGGRVLRSVLTRRLSKDRATAISAKVGQGLAIGFMLWAFYGGGVLLMFIGLFVFVAAGQEYSQTHSASLMAGKRVRDALVTRFETLSHGDTLGRAADLLLATSQQDFPVLGGSEVIGVLSRKALIVGLASLGRDHYVAEAMDREFPRATPDDDLQRIRELIQQSGGLPVLIFEGDRLLGYVNGENLAEYLMIAQSQQRTPA